MSDPLVDLVNDIKTNGIGLVTIITLITLIKKEHRNHQLNQRDAALFHNHKVIMQQLGVENEWKNGPRIGFKLMDLVSFKRLLPISCKATLQRKLKSRRKNMNTLKSTKFWLAIIGAVIPVINSEVGLHLDPTTILGILGLFATAIAGIAHVDGKKATNVQDGGTPNVDTQPSNSIGSNK